MNGTDYKPRIIECSRCGCEWNVSSQDTYRKPVMFARTAQAESEKIKPFRRISIWQIDHCFTEAR